MWRQRKKKPRPYFRTRWMMRFSAEPDLTVREYMPNPLHGALCWCSFCCNVLGGLRISVSWCGCGDVFVSDTKFTPGKLRDLDFSKEVLIS